MRPRADCVAGSALTRTARPASGAKYSTATSAAEPWQPYLIAALATFLGMALEGMIIDTDHWRHFFLMLGMIWGLAAATFRFLRQREAAMAGGPSVYAGAP